MEHLIHGYPWYCAYIIIIYDYHYHYDYHHHYNNNNDNITTIIIIIRIIIIIIYSIVITIIMSYLKKHTSKTIIIIYIYTLWLFFTVRHGKIHHAIKFGKPSISIRVIYTMAMSVSLSELLIQVHVEARRHRPAG